MTQAQRARALGLSTRMLRNYQRRGCPAELEPAREWLEANVVRRLDRDPDMVGFHAAGVSDLINSGLFFHFATYCFRGGVPEVECARTLNVLVASAADLLPRLTGGKLHLSMDFRRWRARPYSRPTAPGKTPVKDLPGRGGRRARR